MKNINLNLEDKNKIRENLISFMEKNPAEENGFFHYINWKPALPNLQLNFKTMPLFLALILLIGSGTTVAAAEGSLPGDTLYPVKNFTEEVRGWAKFGAESKAHWQAVLSERRLEEAEELLNGDRLTEEAKNKIEENIQKHIERANARLAEMQERGNAKAALNIAAKLEGSFRNREMFFDKLSGKFEKFSEKNASLALKFQEKAELAAQKRNAIEEEIKDENSPETKSAAEGKMKAAENKLAEAKKFFDAKRPSLSEEIIKIAADKLAEAQKAHDDGKARLNEEKYGEAFVLFAKAHRLAQDAKMICTRAFARLPFPETPTSTPGSATSTPGSATSTSVSVSKWHKLKGSKIIKALHIADEDDDENAAEE